MGVYCFFLFKQKTADEMSISDRSSDVCSSDLKESMRRGTTQRKGGGSVAEPTPISCLRFIRAFRSLRPITRQRVSRSRAGGRDGGAAFTRPVRWRSRAAGDRRSEERRVTKEWCSTCRSRWSPSTQQKKNKN